jgi:hypothetical protein
MKTAFFALVAATALSLVSAVPAQKARSIAARSLVARDACTVCDDLGPACIAACIAGGPFDPVCDFCATPEIWECINVSRCPFFGPDE